MGLRHFNLLTAVVCVFSLAFSSGQEALSQTGTKSKTSAGTTTAKQKAPAPDRGAFKDSKLVDSVPQLPEFPNYTGKIEFSLCRAFPNAGRGGYMIIARTQETADQVLTWYKTSLPMQGWRLSQRQTHDSKIGAESKQGNVCHLSASPINETPWRCRLVINYELSPTAQTAPQN